MLDSHTEIFGNLCNFTDRFNELKIYSKELAKIIEDETLKYVSDKEQYDIKTEEFDRKFHFVNDTFKRNLRTSIIVSLVTIMENELHQFCNMMKRIDNINIKHNTFKGTILEQFKIYINDVVDLRFELSKNNWKLINEIIELRNCIVHHDSNLEDWYGRKFAKIEVIRNLSQAIPSIIIDEESSNIILGDGSCSECITVVESFFNNLYKHTLLLYPKANSTSSIFNKNNSLDF